MLLRLFLLLITIPLLETILLLLLADRLGFLATFALVIASGLSGAWLLKRQGLRAVRKIREESAAGRFPAVEVIDGVMIVAAGIMLMTPGILTDSLGIALLVPASRSWLRRRLMRWGQSRWERTTESPPFDARDGGAGSSRVIDSYVVRSANSR